MKKNRTACYLSVDIAAGENVAHVNEQLLAFEREIAKGRHVIKLYADILTDERVPYFGDKAVTCGEAVKEWGARHPAIEVSCSITIASEKPKP